MLVLREKQFSKAISFELNILPDIVILLLQGKYLIVKIRFKAQKIATSANFLHLRFSKN